MRRIGAFPGSLDPLLMTAMPADAEFAYLVPADSAEAEWAQTFLPPEVICCFEMSGTAWSSATLNTELALRFSNLDRVLKKNSIGALLITHRHTDFIADWGERNGVKILASRIEDSRRLENKLSFDRFLRKYELPVPGSAVFNSQRPREGNWKGPLVVQVPDSFGGVGTFFLDSWLRLDPMVQKGLLVPGKDYLVREKIEGSSFGITVFVADALVALSAIRQQCFFPEQPDGSRVFAGIQWIGSMDLSGSLRNKLQETFSKLGEILYLQGFSGFANVDFMLTPQEELYIIECNPRLSSATPQLMKFPELMSGVEAGRLFLEDLLNVTARSRDFSMCPFPENGYAGALLDIPAGQGEPLRITKVHPVGLYRQAAAAPVFVTPDIRPWTDSGQEFICCSTARFGEVYEPGDTVATLITNTALFDSGGALNLTGMKFRESFCYD